MAADSQVGVRQVGEAVITRDAMGLPIAFRVEWAGYDARGVPRVWGAGVSHDIAETQARAAAVEYLKRGPAVAHAGPLDAWTFRPVG